MCNKIITPQAKMGAINRVVPARECTVKVWRDGWCKIHHPQLVYARKWHDEWEWRKDRDNRKKRETQEKDSLNEQNCVMFLLELGYTVTKNHVNVDNIVN